MVAGIVSQPVDPRHAAKGIDSRIEREQLIVKLHDLRPVGGCC
jgi:hypothetical protein